jgi:hypothetical protein
MIQRTHSGADAARSGRRSGVREVPPPAESGVASWFDADLADAFAVPIDAADMAKGMDSLARSTLGGTLLPGSGCFWVCATDSSLALA